MTDAIYRGLKNKCVLLWVIKLPRQASSFLIKANGFKSAFKRRSQVFAYAPAVAE
jgi:invasion protein IalB